MSGTHPTGMHSCYYCLQTKFVNVMFLHVSVILSIGGWYPSMPCRSPGGGIPACLAGLQAHTQGEVEGSGLGGLQVHNQREVEGSGLGGLQAHIQGASRHNPEGCLQAHTQMVSRPTPGGSPCPCPRGYPSMH